MQKHYIPEMFLCKESNFDNCNFNQKLKYPIPGCYCNQFLVNKSLEVTRNDVILKIHFRLPLYELKTVA